MGEPIDVGKLHKENEQLKIIIAGIIDSITYHLRENDDKANEKIMYAKKDFMKLLGVKNQ